jgi:hypothetical protein
MADNFQDNGTDDAFVKRDASLEPALPEDNDTPFSPPDDSVEDATGNPEDRRVPALDDTHQVTDSATDIDKQELYDEGLSGAVEAEEPNAGNAVIGYDPDKDQRQSSSTDASDTE